MARPNTRLHLRRIARRLTKEEFAAVHSMLREKRRPTTACSRNDKADRQYYVVLDEVFDDFGTEDLKDDV